MKTLRLHAPGDLRFHDEPTPQPRVKEQLVRVKGGEPDHKNKNDSNKGKGISRARMTS